MREVTSTWWAWCCIRSQDAPDAVAIEMRQEVCDHDEGQVVEGEVGALSQGADHGSLLVCGLPRQVMRPRRTVQAVQDAPLAPLSNGLGADRVAFGQYATGLRRAGYLCADGRSGAGIRMDLDNAPLAAAPIRRSKR